MVNGNFIFRQLLSLIGRFTRTILKRLAIITTHPIQYYAPLFKLLTKRKNIQVKVFYTWGEAAKGKLYDPGFGKAREWDIPLLEGYEYEFVHNISSKPGSHHYSGIDNPGLKKMLHKWEPDAVLVFGWKFKSHLQVMRHYKGRIPVLFRGDSTLLGEKKGFGIKKNIRKWSLRWVYRHIDYALYVGTNNKAYFMSNGLRERQLIFAPHAIDNDRFINGLEGYEKEALQWKEALQIPANKPVVLFAGKLEPKKNPLLLVEMAKEYPGVHFIIIGNGSLNSLMKQKTREMPNVTRLPFQNQSIMPVVYRLCDIFVLPSKGPNETWGLAINEAMACGRIIIVSNQCGGAIDLVKNGENGFVIEPLYNQLAATLQILLDNEKNWDKMKKVSISLIQEFSLENVCKKIEAVVINNKISS